MKPISDLLLAFCTLISVSIFAQNKVKLSSPDDNIVFNFQVTAHSASYSISYKDKSIIHESRLSLKFADADFSDNLHMLTPYFHEGDEAYELIVGKTKKVNEHYKEALIPVIQTSMPKRKLIFAVRLFNDGVAFRYEFPDDKSVHRLILTDENDNFNFDGNTVLRGLFLPGYTTSHEGTYQTLAINQIKEDTLIDMPALFETPDHIFVGVTEADLMDYAGMYLVKHDGIIRSMLSPLPGQTDIKVKALLPHQSPWRVMIISDRIGTLIESNLITNLAEPCKIKDLSWIKPGKTTFPWWNGNVVHDTINAPGNNFVTNKYYIDFCSRNNIPYHSVVEYGLHEWYTNDGAGFVPGPHADVTKPVPGLDMQEVCDYAKSKGVGIRVWVYWSALYKKLDSAFAQFEKWGIKGMMVDFMDRDDQEMVNIQNEILEKAAAHHLHIQFHGAYKPTGLNRTYPNEYTREGTRNYEVNKWGPGLSPDHDIYMPFTRMLAGSTDYHLGGFRAVPDSLYVAQYTRPLMLGTRCHMLAMYVVLENYLGMVCDYPAAYEGQPGFEFIREVPTTWDETKVPIAKVQEYIAIARRSGNDWYVGVINNLESRTINIPLYFLDEGSYSAEIYTDATDVSTQPNHLIKEKKEMKKNDHILVKLARGGGAVIKITMK
ncbi:MAG TPA: glycoside hydrolase family 97 protein [Puia sp.]|nr:glycoside hydrolase family 97 protein [Puia sp.]